MSDTPEIPRLPVGPRREFLRGESMAARRHHDGHNASMIKTVVILVAIITALFSSHASPQPRDEGNIEKALAQLDPFISQAMQKTHLPGLAVAVVYEHHVVFTKGYGVRKLGASAKVDPETVFEIASLSKPISSTIVASLVGEGDLSWDEKVKDIDPRFQLSNQAATEQVTLKDLFSHRSGLPTGAGDVLEDLAYSRPEILRQIRLVPLAGQFRETYHYSNFGLTEAAIAASLATRKTWEQVAEQQLYSKIGMLSTSSRYSDYANNPNKAALHYLLQDGVYINWFVREADPESPAGGVSSNVRDLAKWVDLQLAGGKFNGQQIVAEEALEETHKPQICSSTPGPVAPGECPNNQFYGLGWNVSHDAEGRLQLSHSGAFVLGASTAVYLLPGEQIGIVALANGSPQGIPESVCLTFLDYFRYGHAKHDYLTVLKPVLGAIIKETQDSSTDYSKLPRPSNPTPAGPSARYKGTYFNPYYGRLQIQVQGRKLVLRLPPRGAYYELSHWDGDTFTYYFASENTGVARRGIKFLDGAKQVLVENLAIINNGLFQKID